MSGQFGEGVSILLRRPATIHRPLTPSIDTDGCSERGRAPSSTIYRPLTPSIDTVESVFRPSRWRREDSVATPAYCLRESMSGGEGRASRLHHPDDVNVVPTDCGCCCATASVLGRPTMLLLHCAGGVGWSSHPRVCFPAPLLDRRPDPGAGDHGAVQGRSVSGGQW